MPMAWAAWSRLTGSASPVTYSYRARRRGSCKAATAATSPTGDVGWDAGRSVTSPQYPLAPSDTHRARVPRERHPAWAHLDRARLVQRTGAQRVTGYAYLKGANTHVCRAWRFRS